MVIFNKMGLLQLVKTKPELRKLFGKRELKIIEKQLLGVRLTQSEKNRLSRDIRKKLQVVKELAKYEGEFELKKSDENKKLIANVKRLVLEDELANNVKRIITFGSSIEKENTLLSDLDIAVEFDKIDEKEAVMFRLRIARSTPDRLDIQVYNVLPDKIKKQIDEKGKVIYKIK